MSHHARRLFFVAAIGFLAAMPTQAQQSPCSKSVGVPSRVIAGAKLTDQPSRSALELVELYVPNTFEVVGSELALWARGEAAGGQVVEPLLLIDGMQMKGGVAGILEGLKAGDLARIAVHKGRASSWQYQPGGAPAVIEVTTVAGERVMLATGGICGRGGVRW